LTSKCGLALDHWTWLHPFCRYHKEIFKACPKSGDEKEKNSKYQQFQMPKIWYHHFDREITTYQLHSGFKIENG